jgi:hypothetical protein
MRTKHFTVNGFSIEELRAWMRVKMRVRKITGFASEQ